MKTSFPTFLAAAGVVLALALALLDPDSSRGLPLLQRLIYWFLHVFGALLTVGVTQLLLRPGAPANRPTGWLAVFLAGGLGSLLFVPVASSFERLFFESAEAFTLRDEIREVVPQVLSFWLLLNLPFLLRISIPEQESLAVEPKASDPSAAEPMAQEDESTSTSLLESLPAALGRHVVAISSELHYLRIYTRQGNALLLGSLSNAIQQEDLPAGVQIHRSHWVVTGEVLALQRRGSALVCQLSTGLELPVSRRKAPEVRKHFQHLTAKEVTKVA